MQMDHRVVDCGSRARPMGRGLEGFRNFKSGAAADFATPALNRPGIVIGEVYASERLRNPYTSRDSDALRLLSFHEADVTAAFDAREFDLRQVLGFRFEPHVFLQIMLRDVVPKHVFVL